MGKPVLTRVPLSKKMSLKESPNTAKAKQALVITFSKSDNESDNEQDSMEALLATLRARKARHAKLKESARATANKAIQVFFSFFCESGNLSEGD